MITGLDHPAIAVAEVDAYADWCCATLGFRKVHRHPKPVWILGLPDGTLLEVMPQDGTPRPLRTTWTPGWSHLALRVPSLVQAEAELDGKVTWDGPAVDAIGGGRVRSFRDPQGNMWQIVERSPCA